MSTQTSSESIIDSSHPIVFLLSLQKQESWDMMYSGLVDAMATRATIRRATEPNKAFTYLMNNTPSAIIVTDPAILRAKPKFRAICGKVIEYVRSGGTAVLATHFPSSVRPPDLTHWFRASWNLPWQFGDYYRTTVHLNPRCQVRRLKQAGLPEEYSQKAVFLKNVAKGDAVYLPSTDSRIESRVFSPDPVDCEQTPVVFAKIGKGWLGYVGDNNTEPESHEVILAMCGL